MSKKELFKLDTLKRYIIYILGKRPDEFGLVPDRYGFIKIKELLQALHEEKGFRFVRGSHINELIMSDENGIFEIKENKIRTTQTEWKFDFESYALDLPKILYTCIRRRALFSVMQKGIVSSSDSYIILSSKKDMALRLGKRKDGSPILLEIKIYEAINNGVHFFRFGDLYLSNWIPSDCIIGPPIDIERSENKKKTKKKRDNKEKDKIKDAFYAGTFLMKEPTDKKGKGKKKKSWKEEARKSRKRKDIHIP